MATKVEWTPPPDPDFEQLATEGQKAALAGLLFRHELKHIHDTQILATLVNEHRPLGLKELMVEVLGWNDTVEVPYKLRAALAACEAAE